MNSPEAFRNSNLTPRERASDLVARMTLEEKVAQLLHPWEKDDDEAVRRWNAHSVGFLYVFWLKDRDDVQRRLMARSRFGIPVGFIQEALHSGAAGGTIFPMPLCLAQSWDLDLVRRVHEVIAAESRAVNASITFSPNADVHTDPRFGRIEEGCGEEPLLTGALIAAMVTGLQGKTGPHGEIDRRHIAATVKHIAAYGRTENGQDGSAADLSERTLRDVYLPSFKAAVDAGCAGIMPAHNELNGIPCHGNHWLLTTILRDEWKFSGAVLADYNDCGGLVGYRVAANASEAACQSLSAGIDMDMGASCFAELTAAVRAGKIAESEINRAVSRCLELKFRLGLFENPFTEPQRAEILDCPAHRALALEAARSGIVLLRNEGNLLPVKHSPTSIAVIGPNACDEKAQLGGYTQFGAGVITVLEGIRVRAGAECLVRHAVGCSAMDTDESGIPAAVELARRSDLAVLVLGDAAETCAESWSGRDGDRASLHLSGAQQQLAEAVLATGTPVVVVLIHGRPQSIVWLATHAGAILSAHRPGEEGGTAIAQAIFGDFSPNGKLTLTWPRSAGQIPMTHFRHHRQYGGRKWTFEENSPLFPFGFGLSYAKFRYSDVRCAATRIAIDGTIEIFVQLANIGAVPAVEIAQVYASDQLASVVRPERQLIAWQRVTLAPAEKKQVIFTIPAARLAFHDANMHFGVEAGAFTFYVGTDSTAQLSVTVDVGTQATMHVETTKNLGVLSPDAF